MNNWFTLRDEVKSSTSCLDILNSRGYHVSRPGISIICPSFIRKGSDSKSFAVYDNVCIDFVTGQHYDQIDLVALSDFDGDLTLALESLAGKKLSHSYSQHHSQLFNDQQSKFSERINYWISELLKNPTVAPNGNQIHILDYLADRGFSEQQVKLLKLGFSPNTQRLIIPFFNRNQQPCYYAARTMKPADPNTPKYSYMKLDDESFGEIADKVIFGIDSVKPGHIEHDQVFDEEQRQVVKLDSHNIRFDYLVVCEGMLDVLSFRADGWSSISGKLSGKQEKYFIDICKAYRDKGQLIFICFDSDKPGQNFQRKCAQLLFQHGIPFVAGHLPETFTVCRHGRQDFGQDINIKDVNDYFAAGGSLEKLVKSARDGLAEIVHNCKDEDELATRFKEAARCCDRWQIDKLKRFAHSVCDIEVETDTDKDGNIIRTEVPHLRFNPKAVNFLYAEAMRPMQDCDIARVVEDKHKLIYDTLGQFYEYTGGVWKGQHDLAIQQKIIRVMHQHITANKLSSVLKFLKADLAAAVQFNTKNNVVFKNGTLWLDEPTTRVAMHPRKVVRKDENGLPMMYQGENGGPVYEEIQVPVTYHLSELPKAKALGLLASSANTCTTYLAILV